jgi:thiamine biosynthesis protein ThiS
MKLHFNGQAEELEELPNQAALTVDALLALKGLSGKRLAVEINGEIVPRSAHASVLLKPGDRIEVIQAIGGG